MRVLHLCSERGWRGGEQQVVYLVEGLLKLNIECVLAVKKGSALERYCIETNKIYHLVSSSNSFDVISAYKIKQICRSEKIHIIHLHSSKAHGVGVLAATLGNKVPMVLSRRVFFVLKNNRFSFWKYTHKQIKVIIGVSKKVTELMQSYVKGAVKCMTVYSGIDLNKFSAILPDKNFLRAKYDIGQDKVLIGIIAALSVEKDHFTFISTIDLLIQRGAPVHAFIIGDGAMREILTEYVKSKNLADSITFTGFQENVKPFLLSLDIFMMTSINEGLGSSILDAFLAKVPVVATNAGGIPELVINNKTGKLADVGDYKMLAEHIESLIVDKDLQVTLIEGAMDFVVKFSKENTAQETLDVYKSILN